MHNREITFTNKDKSTTDDKIEKQTSLALDKLIFQF